MLNRISTLKLKDSKSAPRPTPLEHGTGTTLTRSVLHVHGAYLMATVQTSHIVSHTTNTTVSQQARAEALQCRLFRAGSSFATRMKLPAPSKGTKEHSVHASQCARQVVAAWRLPKLGTRAVLRVLGDMQGSTGPAHAWWRRRVRASSSLQTLKTAS